MEQGFHLNDKQNDLETLGRSLAPAPPTPLSMSPFLCPCKAVYYAKQGGFFWCPVNSSVYLPGILDNYE